MRQCWYYKFFFIAHNVIFHVKQYSVLNLEDRKHLGLIKLVGDDYVINLLFLSAK